MHTYVTCAIDVDNSFPSFQVAELETIFQLLVLYVHLIHFLEFRLFFRIFIGFQAHASAAMFPIQTRILPVNSNMQSFPT